MYNPLLKLKDANLEKNQRILLKNINLEIKDGEVIALLGHNGSGKSTLLKVLIDEYVLTSGQRYCKFYRNEITVLTQQPDESLFPDLTLRENILLWSQRHHDKKNQPSVDQIIRQCPRGDRLTQFLDLPVSKLSGGEKQLFLIGLILGYPPKILFLDENTSNLDAQAAHDVMKLSMDLIKDNLIPTIIITHDLDAAKKYADRFLILKEGELIADIQNNQSITVEQLKIKIFS